MVETDWLKRWFRYTPDRVALKSADTGVSYSYALLYRLSCEIARTLETRFSVRHGDRVAVMSTNEMEYVPLFFAVQRLGAILVPINFRLTGREITHIIEDSGAKLLIAQDAFAETIGKMNPRSVPDKRWSFDGASGRTDDNLRSFVAHIAATHDAEDESERSAARPRSWEIESRLGFEDPCMILYTSGTTGAPKGALITHQMMFWNSVSTGLRLNLTENDVTLSFLPFFHTGGWNVLNTPFLHRGARLVFMKKFEAGRVLQLCETERVTILFGVPTTMDMMFHTPEFKKVDLKSVRYAIVGGEPMPIDLIKHWQARGIPVRQGFGLTEFGPNVFSLPEADSLRKIGSIGFPNFYIDARIVDDRGQDVPTGKIGELILSGPACSPGYWKNDEATRHTIRDGWFYTGDLVRRDEDGYFYVAGRKKDMFISGGENVYPVEIERFLSTHPLIREVAILGVPDAKWGEVGKAYIALVEGAALSASEVLAFCEGNLARYKIPKHVQFLPELPKGDSGKILKRLLKENTAEA
ncbi:MAG: long-chain fatty acid--CoA ligase [Bdellovibrionaceae bacterium]|nr:long-chain fatty acid--CoA ligase [Pseudobdellovibrionaceae bacterium]